MLFEAFCSDCVRGNVSGSVNILSIFPGIVSSCREIGKVSSNEKFGAPGSRVFSALVFEAAASFLNDTQSSYSLFV